jgi:hypothetical protein
MTGKRRTPEDGGAGPEDDKAKLPPRPTEDEEDGDIATPKRDRDDEQQDL